MKDMKVAKKLMLSFIIIAALAVAVGIVGITGMKRMDAASTDMYKSQTEPLAYMSTVTETLQRMRVNMREYAIGAVTGDTNQIENAHTAIEGNKKVMKENIALYRSTLVNPEAIKLFDEAGNLYDTNYLKSLQLAYDLAKAGDVDGVVAAIEAVKSDVEKIDNDLDKCMEIRIASAATTSDNIGSLARTLLALIIIVLLVAVAASLFLAVYISGLISKPLAYLNQGFNRIGTMGEVKFSDEEYKLAVEYAGSKDEVGDTMRMTLLILQRLADVGKNLETVADGDLTGELALLSDKDTMGLSLKKMVDNLNRMFLEINNASEQVATGSEEIAQGSQNLAQGSTDQASVVEQLFASISEVADKTTHNADMAKEAAELSGVIRDNAEKGSLQMDQLMQAVREINEASGSISKVIKVIDDIAFQTNILALNAAIEAARAGQHGRGFAVVAEEVRSLAAKSAEAAKDTSDMIENSIDKANFGLDIATDTTASLKDIVDGINRSTENISQIARSSEEQARAITQINMGIDQVAQVVQQNSATAEESAAAAEEMSSQSLLLQELIGKFRLKK